MTLARLSNLSTKELIGLAERYSIAIPMDSDREKALELIFDALEEDRREMEIGMNLTIRGEARKFIAGQYIETINDFSEGVSVPRRYKENVLELILRDPEWLYCYWDLSDVSIKRIKEKLESPTLFISIKELSEKFWSSESVLDSFEIPVDIQDLYRYIMLPSKSGFYGAELIARSAKECILIMRSNMVESTCKSVPVTVAETGATFLQRLSRRSSDVNDFPGSDFRDNMLFESSV